MVSSDIHSRERNASLGNTTVNNLEVEDGRGYYSIAGHHTNYEAGLTNEEIARFGLGPNERIQIWRIGCQLDGGGTDSNIVLDAYDVSSGTQIGSTTAGSVNRGTSDNPLGESSNGSDVILRLTTGGSAVDVTITAMLNIIDKTTT